MNATSANEVTWMAWGVWWNRLDFEVIADGVDGEPGYIVGSAGKSPVPELRGCTGALMFSTKKECCEYIKKRWKYIRFRKDLRSEPHGWRMPKAVRIKVSVKMEDVP